jgi:aspartyl-tRNA synthetase
MAALVRDQAALKYHGAEFAYLNFRESLTAFGSDLPQLALQLRLQKSKDLVDLRVGSADEHPEDSLDITLPLQQTLAIPL